MRRAFWLLPLPIVLAALAGPVAFLVAGASDPDPSDLYLVVGRGGTLDRLLAAPEVREIGPYRAPFARIVQTSAGFHALLVDRHYWIYPATPLAAICGFALQDREPG